MRVMRAQCALGRVASLFWVACLAGVGCSDSTAGQSHDTSSDSEADTGCEEVAAGYERVDLPMPSDVGDNTTVIVFDTAISGRRSWISAQTDIFYEPGVTEHGQMLLWESASDGAFALASVPSTEIGYFPYLCAVSSEEVYVAVIDGVDSRGRVFARRAGDEARFEEIDGVSLPINVGFSNLRLACFAGGNLWLYGSTQKDDLVTEQRSALYHRAADDQAFEEIPLPEEITAPGWVGGLTAALLRPDGSGYFGHVVSLLARGAERRDIALGLHEAMAARVASLLSSVPLEDDLLFVGGGARNACLRREVEARLKRSALVPSEPQIVAALDAALV